MGYKIQIICGLKIYSRTRTFGLEVHKYIIFDSTDGTTSMKIVNYIERQLLFK